MNKAVLWFSLLFLHNLFGMECPMSLFNKVPTAVERYQRLSEELTAALNQYPLNLKSYYSFNSKELDKGATAEKGICAKDLLLFNYGYKDNTQIIVGAVPKIRLGRPKSIELKRCIDELRDLYDVLDLKEMLNASIADITDGAEELIHSEFCQYNKKDWMLFAFITTQNDGKTFLTQKLLIQVLQGVSAGKRIGFLS